MLESIEPINHPASTTSRPRHEFALSPTLTSKACIMIWQAVITGWRGSKRMQPPRAIRLATPRYPAILNGWNSASLLLEAVRSQKFSDGKSNIDSSPHAYERISLSLGCLDSKNCPFWPHSRQGPCPKQPGCLMGDTSCSRSVAELNRLSPLRLEIRARRERAGSSTAVTTTA